MFIKIDDNDAEFGDLVSVDIFSQMCDNVNHLIDATSIGSIKPIMRGITGVPIPDPNIWQECDGSQIVHPTSPIRNSYVPDYKTLGRYMRMYDSIGEVGNLSGNNVKNLTHDHGGVTDFSPPLPQNADADTDTWSGKDHRHTLPSDLTAQNFEPEHVRIRHYMKINDANTIYGGRFQDLEKDFSTSIAQALWIKQANTINSLNKTYPIGMLLMSYNSQSNLPATPNLNYFQLLDGSTVTNPLSPLNGIVLPDMRGKFFRHPQELDIDISTGGQNSVNLQHNHGGFTQLVSDRNGIAMDGGGEMFEAEDHNHTISNTLGTVTTIPQYMELQFYVRII